jgi:multidrug efflux pump subunit AcrB
MWEPMAITIIFGLIFATALTLGVVPVLYSMMFRVRFL